MNQILVISDNELLSQLYTTNLEVYLAANVTTVSTFQDAKIKISENPDYRLIITVAQIKDMDLIAGLQNFFKETNLIIPIIGVGEIKNLSTEIIEIKSTYNIQNLVRSAAKILNVTAKSMIKVSVPKFYPIDINYILDIKKAPASLFLELKKKGDDSDYDYVIFANKGNDVDAILRKFKNEGVERVFVNANDRLNVIDQITLILCDTLKNTESQSLTEKNVAVSQTFDFLASSFLSQEASEEIVNLAQACTKVMEEVVSESPDLKSLLNVFLENKNGFIYKHSMLSAYVASHIVRNVPWGGDAHVEKINFVLFFHDVQLAPIFQKYPGVNSEEDLLFVDELSNKEKEIVLNHARLSAEMVTQLKKFPLGADLLIKQHHGMSNGVGFAIDFKDDISPLSKIIIVAEAFVHEFMTRKEADKESPLNIAEVIKLLNDKFKKPTYKKIIDTLKTIRI